MKCLVYLNFCETKFSRCTVRRYTGEWKDLSHSFLTIALRGCERLPSRSGQFKLRNSLNRYLIGLLFWFGCFGENNNCQQSEQESSLYYRLCHLGFSKCHVVYRKHKYYCLFRAQCCQYGHLL